MLRPEMVITHCKDRGQRRLSDFPQLIDGINVGGRIIVGGGPDNAKQLLGVMKMNQRMGIVLSVAEIKDPLDPNLIYTLDLVAITQMLMVAKNEAFHQTVDQMLNVLQQACVTDGHSIEMGLQMVREMADQIGHL